VNKKGLLLPKKTIKESKIHLTKEVIAPPCSIFFSEPYSL